MKYIKIIIAIVLLITSGIYAQDIPMQNISLAQAIETGIKNRHDAQANKVNFDLANNTVQKNKKEWLPNITLSGNILYNTQLQSMIFPEGFGGGGDTKVNIGTKNQTTFALDLTQNIYNPTLNTDVKIARNDVLLEEEKNKEKEISIKQSIAEAYLNVILKAVQLKLSNASLDRSLQYYTIAKDKHHLMAILDNDLLKTQLDYENTKIAAQQAKNNYDLSLTQLKYQVNIDTSTLITLTDSIETFQKEYALERPTSFIAHRTEIKQLSLQLEANKLKLTKSTQYYLPIVTLIANYSTQFQSEDNNYFRNLWSPYNYVGLKVSMPITGNFKNALVKTEYRLKMHQNELQLNQKHHDVEYEIVKYKTILTNEENTIKTGKSNLELSRSLYNSQLNVYRLGTVTYSSVLDMENSLSTAEENYIKAVYNYLLAKINYEKAIGKL